MNDCIFCTIITKDDAKLVWQNDYAVAFNDIHPKAPLHMLVVPKRHIARLSELDDLDLAGQMLMAVREVAVQQGIQDAYRVHLNNGQAAGQVVDHLHFHVLGKFSAEQVEKLRQGDM